MVVCCIPLCTGFYSEYLYSIQSTYSYIKTTSTWGKDHNAHFVNEEQLEWQEYAGGRREASTADQPRALTGYTTHSNTLSPDWFCRWRSSYSATMERQAQGIRVPYIPLEAVDIECNYVRSAQKFMELEESLLPIIWLYSTTRQVSVLLRPQETVV